MRRTRLAHYAADVARVAAALPAPPAIVAQSMGAVVAQHYLATHPAPAAVLLAPPPTGALATTLRIARRHPRAFARVLRTRSLLPLVATPALAREHLFSAAMPPALVAAHARRLQDESFRGFLDMLGLDLPRPARVRTPLLVLGAAEDRIFPPGEVAATARAYRTRAEIFPGMAHDMMLEAGWRAVADRILAWLGGRGL